MFPKMAIIAELVTLNNGVVRLEQLGPAIDLCQITLFLKSYLSSI